MSTILKALRRLEEDRRSEDERSLRDRILSKETAGGERVGGLDLPAAVLGVVGVFALLVAGAVSWWMLADGSPGPAGGFAEETAPVFREDTVAEPEEVASSIGLPAVSAPPPTAPSEASFPPATVSPSVVAVATSSPGIAEDIRLITRPPKPVAEAPAPPVARAAAPTASRSAPPPKPAPAVEVRASETPAIRTIERPPMPEFVVTRTVWHPEAGRRVAMIRRSGQSAAQAFGEGETLGVLEVVEIQPTGVLFRRDGVEIKRRVGR